MTGNYKGALPRESEYEILHKNAIIIGLICLLVVLVFCYIQFYVIPLYEESQRQFDILNKEFDCSNPYQLFSKYPNMNEAMHDYILHKVKVKCKV